jgi:hypothetical protein
MNADPVELLDRLGPPDGWSAHTDLDTDPVAAQLLGRVFAHTGNVVSLDAARRRRRGIGGAIVVAALVAGGAVAAVWNRSPQETRRVACWSEAVAPPEQRAEVAWDARTDPIELCAGEWSGGRFGAIAPPAELRACVTANNTAAVIPGESDVCDTLGLADYSANIDRPALVVNDAQRELDQLFFVTENCVPLTDSEEVIKGVLDRFGLSGWTIQIADTTDVDEACATVLLVAELRTVFINPVQQQD